jgi:hypothetical protein
VVHDNNSPRCFFRSQLVWLDSNRDVFIEQTIILKNKISTPLRGASSKRPRRRRCPCRVRGSPHPFSGVIIHSLPKRDPSRRRCKHVFPEHVVPDARAWTVFRRGGKEVGSENKNMNPLPERPLRAIFGQNVAKPTCFSQIRFRPNLKKIQIVYSFWLTIDCIYPLNRPPDANPLRLDCFSVFIDE